MAAATMVWKSGAAIQLGQMSIKIGTFNASDGNDDYTIGVEMADSQLCLALDQTNGDLHATSISSQIVTVAGCINAEDYAVIIFGQ